MDEANNEAKLRDANRMRRARTVRARTINMNRYSKQQLEFERELLSEDNSSIRPRTRSECVNGARPCPFVSCVHHLYLDVLPRTGSIKLNFPDLEVDEMKESCVLDVAERGGATIVETAEFMNLTRERIRHIELDAFTKLHNSIHPLREHADGGGVVKRRLKMLSDSIEAENDNDADD